jgi:hypothetical protein
MEELHHDFPRISFSIKGNNGHSSNNAFEFLIAGLSNCQMHRAMGDIMKLESLG